MVSLEHFLITQQTNTKVLEVAQLLFHKNKIYTTYSSYSLITSKPRHLTGVYHFQSVLLTASVLPSLQTFAGMGPLIQFSPALTNKRFLQKTAHSATMASSVCCRNNTVLCCQACKSKEEGPRVAAPTNEQVNIFVHYLTRRQ